jgi:hypothetical protein
MSAETEASNERNRFLGSRYERLRQGAEILADDPAIVNASYPFDCDGLREFVAAVAEQRTLDRLSERDSDMLIGVLLLGYHRGPGHIAWHIHDWMSETPRNQRDVDDAWIVLRVLASILTMILEGLANLHGGNGRHGRGAIGAPWIPSH